MNKFVSDISGKELPIEERIPGRSVRNCILDEIRKDQPGFGPDAALSVDELSEYRSRYIRKVLEEEKGTLSSMEQEVLNNLSNDKLISDSLSDATGIEERSFAARLSDGIAAFGGSWPFIILFVGIIISWITINSIGLLQKPFDSFPYILLNLVLSCVAAVQAPLIMMSQNRQEEKDRQRARNDYMVNLKSELEIRMLHEKIDHLLMQQHEAMMEIQQVQIDMMGVIIDKMNHRKDA